MSDFADHLPLSQRRAFDESRVSGDWRGVTSQCLDRLIEVLVDRPNADWDAPSLRPGWRVRDVIAELLWRARGSALDLLVDRFRAVFRDPRSPDPDVARVASSSPDELLERLRWLASDRSMGVGRRGIIDLSDAVSRAYEVSRALDQHLPLPAIATGAVCLARILTAPLPIRAALAGRSLQATDAGWTVGRGTPVSAPAEQHVLFLFGRLDHLPGE